MPSPARRPSLKLLPHIAAGVRLRANELNQTASSYIGILIWNQLQAPEDLKAEPDSTNLARVDFPCSFRKAVSPQLRRVAKAAGLSENATVEALLARDQRKGGSLTIFRAR